MKKQETNRTKRGLKALAFILSLATVFSVVALPSGFLASALSELSFPLWSDFSDQLDGIEIPFTGENPYDVKVDVGNLYPVFTSQLLNWNAGDDEVERYRTHMETVPGASRWYTASISPWYDYDLLSESGEVTGALPYRDEREEILHGDLVLQNTEIGVTPINDPDTLGFGTNHREAIDLRTLWSYGLDEEQVMMRVRARVLSGKGSVFVEGLRRDYEATGAEATEEDADATLIEVDVPITELSRYSTDAIRFRANGYGAGDTILSNPGIFLVDDTSPSVTHVIIEPEVREDGTADLVLTLNFNEQVRFASAKLGKETLDNLWVEVLLREHGTQKTSTARLYLERMENGTTLYFRGDIGEYHYRNYTIDRITNVSFDQKYRFIDHAVIDLADRMYESAYKTVEYGNRILVLEEEYYANTTAICDVAGNPLNGGELINWRFRNQSYEANSFEATRVEVYNEYTLGRAEGKLSGKADTYEMIAGPDNELTVFVYLDRYLTFADAKKVYIDLNLKNADGTPVRATVTSVSGYLSDEVYGGTREGTLLKYEGIPLSADMTWDGETGDAVEPLIWAVRMTDDIEDKTAYQPMPKSATKIYADLDAPVSTVETYGAQTHTDAQGNVTHYTLSFKAEASDPKPYKYNAGVLDTYASLSLGVDGDTDVDVRYVFRYGEGAAQPPESLEGYTETATLPAEGFLKLGSFKVLNDPASCYLHLYIPTQGLSMEGFEAAFHVTDKAGNGNTEESFLLPHRLDERAPTVTIGEVTHEVLEGNTQIRVHTSVSAVDPAGVQRIEYFVGDLTPDAEWTPLLIEEGLEVRGAWEKTYGGFGAQTNRVYEETVHFRATDAYGNVSEPVSKGVTVSLQKPVISARPVTDTNAVSTAHDFRVTGAPVATLGGATAFVRATLSPEGDEYSYVTLIKTGEERNLFDFENTVWYRVKIESGKYVAVSERVTLGADLAPSKGHPMEGLLFHYGEVRITLEGGYGDMIPVAGESLHAAPDAGSYVADESKYTVRFASPYLSEMEVHGLDFGTLSDRTGAVVMADTDPGAAPYVFGATARTVNPMRNATFTYHVSNLSREDFGLLDLDTDGSYAELLYYANDGDAPVTVARRDGLTPTATQYFTVANLTDGGEYFGTGAYFLRVTLKSRSGHVQFFDSATVLIDAETAQNAGVWKYDYTTVADPATLEKLRYGEKNPYTTHEFYATDAPYSLLGVSVPETTGEQMRSGVFAVYSYGVETLWMHFSNPDGIKTVAGVELGRVAGYQVWNLLSDPSEEELGRAPFRKNTSVNEDGTPADARLSLYNDLEVIYSEETIPKGIDAVGELHLHRGVNTICYRVQMENGYISPVRQLTVNVTEFVPELNIAVDNYVPSASVSQREGTVNAHSVRFFVESAYSLNESGEVDVQLWSDYGMNVGRIVDGETVTEWIEDPSYLVGNDLEVLTTGLSEGDFAEFTENSYTANFPRNNSICSAVFVAIDAYGGVTFVAPQLGDHHRADVYGGEVYWNEYMINYYGDYYRNPYDSADPESLNTLPWRVHYNVPSYFGRDLLAFTTYLEYENEEYEVLEISHPSLDYNLFNIVTNDVSFDVSLGQRNDGETRVALSGEGKNLHLINPAESWVTVSGEEMESVTLPLASPDVTVGYLGAVWTADRFTLTLAQPTADAEHPAGTTSELTVKVHGKNYTGQDFILEREVTLTYRDPALKVEMTEAGAQVTFGVHTAEYGSTLATGIYENGTYPISFTDCFGLEHSTTFTVTDDAHAELTVTKSNAQKTAQPVSLRLLALGALSITVNVTDYGIMTVTGNGTHDVTVVLTGNTRFSFSYTDAEGYYRVGYLTVDNVVTPAPRAVYSVGAESYSTDKETGESYRYGDVTVWLTDPALTLVDRYTGKTPTFTFTPGGVTEYVFRAKDIEARLGEERVILEKDIKVKLPYTLREPFDPMAGAFNDTETPNLRIRAYANVGGVYSDRRVSLTLASANATRAFGSRGDSYYDYRYVGGRANAFELLDAIGWGTDYRFAIDVSDSGRVRLFIKEGLYNTVSPDFETGLSDEIAGVALQSRLLTVSENAQFTLFAVDARGNVSQVAFDVTGLSDAPVPTLFKVPASHDTVRVYILPPQEAGADFEVLGYDNVMTDTDPASAQNGKLYIELHENDDFIINYAYEYMGERVSGALPVSVSEISLDEMTEMGREYSANAEAEWTALDVGATVYFSHTVKEAKILDSGDHPVTLTTSGNVLSLLYSDNAHALRVQVTAENGTSVTVTLSEITNIDKSAPTVEEVERTLAPDGKSLTLTLRTDDRTVLANTGAAGEERADGYYYYTRVLTANGEFTYRFANAAGAIGEITVKVTELVLEPLAAEYARSEDGANAVTDPALLSVGIGETVYVRPNRAATALFSDGTEKELSAGTWTAFKVSESLGATQPYLVLTDAYGNVLVSQFSQIKVPDRTAPEIVLARRTLSVREGTDAASVKAELLRNASVFDNEAGEISISVEIPAQISSVGVYEVLYRAVDAAGNETTLAARLRVTSIYEPVLFLGETRINRDDGIYVSAGQEILLSVDTASISWRAVMDTGIRTAAQMKENVTVIVDYNTGNVLNLGVLEKGTYTLCIVTQSRDYFRVLISVE